MSEPTLVTLSDEEIDRRIRRIIDCRSPYLIGVRHHSAAIARTIAQMLDEIRPTAVLVELPSDLADWIPYLAEEGTIAPVALSAAGADRPLYFYPLAEFSPELVAIRWAIQRRVPVIPCDLATTANLERNRDFPDSEASLRNSNEHITADNQLLSQLLRRTNSHDTGQLWERIVETPGMLADAETIRRAALTFGWAVRAATPLVARDAIREVAMRMAARAAPPGAVAIVGAFHAEALSSEAQEKHEVEDRELWPKIEFSPEPSAVSLIPYDFSQLDERSGYPAGICDPVWHQRVMACDGREELDHCAVSLVTEICRELRKKGHVAGTPDATEVIRMMRDLARLRQLSIAGRGEMLEAIESCLVQGELLGRGRAVARAAEQVLIGDRRGQVSSNVPRCGLSVDIDRVLKLLNLPDSSSQSDEPREVRLDVMRSAKDRARAVTLRRLCAAQVQYAERLDTVEQGTRENLIEVWNLKWEHATTAQITLAGRLGVTLPQVVESMARGPTESVDPIDNSVNSVLQQLTIAADCGIGHLFDKAVRQLDQYFLTTANLSQIVTAATWIGRVVSGQVVGLPNDRSLAFPPILEAYQLDGGGTYLNSLLLASLDRLVGIEGSDSRDDVLGLVDLVQWFTGDLVSQFASNAGSASAEGLARLLEWCRRTVERGSHRMRGAAAAMLGVLGESTADRFATVTEAWYDNATTAEGRSQLRYGIAGAIDVILPLAQSNDDWLDGLERRFGCSLDADFLERLPSLRSGFGDLSPADRRRLLDARLMNYTDRRSRITSPLSVGTSTNNPFDIEPDPTLHFARLRTADLAGRAAVQELIPDFFPVNSVTLETTAASSQSDSNHDSESTLSASVVPRTRELPAESISLADRWRLVLGISDCSSPQAMKAARSLDRLYGRGRGEGARGSLVRQRGSSPRGGTEAPTPTVLEWKDELESLFGNDVCQEVLGAAAAGGDFSAIDLLDANEVQPSVELLRQVLALTGALPEAKSEKLRRLARELTRKLAERLAIRLRPALNGLSTPRPTRRRHRKLHLTRTIRDNLSKVFRRAEDQRPRIAAERLVFHSTSRREMDWHLTFVVDVSGSMSASVVYSALVAAVLADLPALTVRFLAFSTEVIDLSDQCEDPLSLLLEVQVGGGTDIGLGLRAARAGIKQPTRSIVVLVTDFEEGVSIGAMVAEVRALATSGVKCLGLASLDDSGTARFHQGLAQFVVAAGMPVAAVSPQNLVRWIGDQIRGAANQSASGPVGTV